MLSNREIRRAGRENLRGYYLMAIANMFLIGVASSIMQYLIGAMTGVDVANYTYDGAYSPIISDGSFFFNFILTIIATFIISLLTMGYQWGYLDIQDGEPMTVSHLWKPFKRNALKAVGFIFRKQFFIFLWSLLFVIPGILKTYSWAMAEFIYYDNPEIENRLILAKSEEMMRGKRWKLFRIDFYYALLYLLPLLLWFVYFVSVIYTVEMGGDISNGTVWFTLVFSIILVLILTAVLAILIEPRRYAANAVFYSELVQENER